MGRLLRSALFPLIVIVLLVYLAAQALLPESDSANAHEIRYGELIAKVGETPELVESVLFIPERHGIEATLHDGRTVETSYPTDASQVRFQELLERQGVRFDSRGTGDSSWWSILTYLLPFVLFFAFWIFLMDRVQRARERPPGFPQDRGDS
jgi:cell division protease FtsH